MENLKRKRAGQAGNITRILNKLQDAQRADLDSLSIPQLERHISSLKSANETYQQLHEDIIDNHSDGIDQAEEDQALAKHMDAYEEAELLAHQLLSLASAYHDALSIRSQVQDIENRIREFPDKSYSASILTISEKFSKIETEVNRSSIPREHLVRKLITELSSAITQLMATDKAPSTVVGGSSSSSSSSSSSRASQVQLPKIALPTFCGDPMKWAAFWNQFQSAIHGNSDLSQANKLTYLRSAIKDPQVSPLLFSAIESENHYENMITLLKQRYDKRRLIHKNYAVSLVDWAPLTKETKSDFRALTDKTRNSLQGLQNMGQYNADVILTSLYVYKLPKVTQTAWEQHTKHTKDVLPIEKLLGFLEERAEILPDVDPPHQQEVKSNQQKKGKAAVHHSQVSSSQVSSSPQASSSQYNCVLCNAEKHSLYACPKFNAMTVEDKFSHVKMNNRCFNCLCYGHKTKDCLCSTHCKKCAKMHHTSLHRESTPSSVTPSENIPQSIEVATTNTIAPQSTSSLTPNLMMTSQVVLEAPSGKKLAARALLDSGSSVSLISSRTVQCLQLQKTPQQLSLSGAQGVDLGYSTSLVNVILSPTYVCSPKIPLTAAVVNKVTCNLPLQDATNVRNLPYIKTLDLADPTFDKPGRVDLLIGCDAWQDIMKPETKKGNAQEPMARNTIFGWAIIGRYTPDPVSLSPPVVPVCNISTNESVDSLLLKFWEIEEASNPAPNFTSEEKVVMQHFNDNHVYLSTGKYKVALPRRANVPSLGDSRKLALQRFEANEKSITRKGNWAAFQQVVQEYLDLGHAEQVPKAAINTPSCEHYYLPMHSVTKTSSTSTKLRVVFDASAKTTSNISLNDTLLVGPTLFPHIDEILLRFRTYAVAISADISKMYRAVELAEEDRDFHRFLWRPDRSGPIQDYRMTRVTFGVASSPSLAVQALQQTAHDFGDSFPLAKPHVLSSFYVDDFLAGANTPEEALQLQQQLRELLLKGGFDLRKWRSSSTQVLQNIDSTLHEQVPTKSLTDDHSSQHPKALGMVWDSISDTMCVSVGEHKEITPTKRGVISDIARTFDVLGWLAPSLIIMKIMLQQLWELKLAWDEEIPAELQKQHAQWRHQLLLLKEKLIPRCYYKGNSTRITIQLHGFSDASENAHAAVVYIRATYSDSHPTVSLVTAKTKVAPLKKLTIPRLELCGASLLAKLLTTTRLALNIPLCDTYAWCDSSIVLYWLDGSPRRFKTFVANRVSTILNRLPPTSWNYVPTESNPADCASRGLFPQDLLNHDLWWDGPSWLHSDPIQWPPQPFSLPLNTPEIEPVVCNVVSCSSPVWIEERFDTYDKLVKVNAWIQRFISNLKLKVAKKCLQLSSTLSTTEIRLSEQHLFARSQDRHFQEERHHLSTGKPLRSSSKLLALNPSLGDGGLLVVGGRLSNSQLALSQKHPPILASKDVLTRLMFRSLHVSLCHCGPSLLLSHASRSVHVLGARQLARTICRSCVVCKKVVAKLETQQMGQLPRARVTPSPAFDKTGIDYAGPFLLKKGHTRRPVFVKTYLCVFICFSTKATHLEAVSDLTTEAFMACLKRFTSRRGLPSEIHTDNGSNFKGASHQLADLYQFLRKDSTQEKVNAYLLSNRITWIFSPERAPHFGGLWEAAVKSAKYHLKRVIGAQKFNYEEFCTILCQVESCMNSRPLLPINCHSEDGIEVLTPGHFLIGRPLKALPERDNIHTTSPLRRWTLCQNLVQHFWQRWSNEYLQQLQRLQKWKTPRRDIAVGDIVIIKEDSAFTNHWPLAKVVATFPGKDGKVRVVQVKTSTSLFKRPISKLALILEANSSSQEPGKGHSPFEGECVEASAA